MNLDIDQFETNVIGLLFMIAGVTTGNLLLQLGTPKAEVVELVTILLLVGVFFVLFGSVVNVGQYIHSLYRGDTE